MSPARIVALLFQCLSLSAVAACAMASDVRGPDGEHAHVVTCQVVGDCYAKVEELCPNGFVLQGGLSRNMLASCKEDVPAAPVTLTSSPASDREDTRTCEAASRYAGQFGTFWAQHAKGETPLESAPSATDFSAVCRTMPDNIQRCMHEQYREAHTAACDAALQRIAPAERARIDGLFLEAPRG